MNSNIEKYFTVIVPVFNDTERLKKCLKSLNNQTLEKSLFNIIVVNNNEEEFLDLDLQEYKNLKIIYEPEKGSYASRNKGITFSKTEILAFTDSDCLPDENWLINAKKYFDNDLNKEIGVLTGPVPLFFKQVGKLTSAELYEKYTGFDFKSYASEGACGAGNWFSYKAVLEEFGGFNSKLRSNGDTELSKKISRKYRIIYAEDIIVRHPARDSISSVVFKYQRLMGGVYQRKFKSKPLSFFVYLLNFILRRFKFMSKKIFTVSLKDSYAINMVCIAIIFGVSLEYFRLIFHFEPKR
ncbi:glycosyltransferase [Pleomorphovibrio marinus]|uniref:glycosyltransferase n=1 Tax=Pleomorphovibrio marinus TaxID=2164132 RepID=UPI000E09FCA2|nr:glycosyltransferase family A protein [Pleomorphovibrio marinus]